MYTYTLTYVTEYVKRYLFMHFVYQLQNAIVSNNKVIVIHPYG